jgi:hypothetical protein
MIKNSNNLFKQTVFNTSDLRKSIIRLENIRIGELSLKTFEWYH